MAKFGIALIFIFTGMSIAQDTIAPVTTSYSMTPKVNTSDNSYRAAYQAYRELGATDEIARQQSEKEYKIGVTAVLKFALMDLRMTWRNLASGDVVVNLNEKEIVILRERLSRDFLDVSEPVAIDKLPDAQVFLERNSDPAEQTEYLGLTYKAAYNIATSKNFKVKIASIDNIVSPGNYEYDTQRVNFSVENGFVTSARIN